jgi:hypothetical protein
MSDTQENIILDYPLLFKVITLVHVFLAFFFFFQYYFVITSESMSYSSNLVEFLNFLISIPCLVFILIGIKVLLNLDTSINLLKTVLSLFIIIMISLCILLLIELLIGASIFFLVLTSPSILLMIMLYSDSDTITRFSMTKEVRALQLIDEIKKNIQNERNL